jgi:hypothetical protein
MTRGEWVGVAIGFAVPLAMVALGFVLARLDGRL